MYCSASTVTDWEWLRARLVLYADTNWTTRGKRSSAALDEVRSQTLELTEIKRTTDLHKTKITGLSTAIHHPILSRAP